MRLADCRPYIGFLVEFIIFAAFCCGERELFMNLSVFLAQNALSVENVKFVASKRFLDEDKRPVEWEIEAISSTEDENLRKNSVKRVAVPGRRGQFSAETDYAQYFGMLAARCTVFPNLNDTDLQESYGVMGADSLLKVMLTPGEYGEYVIKVQELNGFLSRGEECEDAKNS